MGKLSNKDEEGGHSFWQNYTDLMSGLMIVFLIAAAASLLECKHLSDENENLRRNTDTLMTIVGIVPGQGESLDSALHNLVSNAQLYEQVKAFDEAQRNLESEYFKYDESHHRFICKINVQFQQNSYVIDSAYNPDLIAAGEQLRDILSEFHKSEYIGFKVVIDGRAARHYDGEPSNESVDRLSYERARQLYNLWRENNIIQSIEDENGDVSVSGSGFYGSGRYPFAQEALNKQFIIQIIPYIKF